MIRFRAGKAPRGGLDPRGVLGDDKATLADPARKLPMCSRVVPVDAAPEHGHGHAAGLERASVGLTVHSPRKAADHDEPRACELTPEQARHMGSVAGARAGTDHGHCCLAQHRQLG